MKRFVFVLNIPSPYRLHLCDAIWEECKNRGIDFHVHFMAHSHKERPKLWSNPKIDFPHTYWRDYGFGAHHFNPGLVWRIMRNPPEFLLAGSPYDTLTCILILLFAKVPVKVVGAEGNTKTPGKMDGIVGRFKRLIYSKGRFASVPGSDAVNYIALHQARTTLMMPTPVIMPNLVDEKRFKPRTHWDKENVESARRELGARAQDRLCIIPARLEPVKGIIPFVRQLTPEVIRGWHITIVGQGSLKDEIVAEIHERGLDGRMSILDYVPYDKMPLYYAASDLLLLPSIYDPNPLSVPEALFSGLPIALSDQAGNVEEGVVDGINGWKLPVKDAVRYPAVLKEIFTTDINRLREMGNCSLACNAKFWDTRAAVKQYLDVIVGETRK